MLIFMLCGRAGMPASVKDEVGDVKAALDLETLPPKVQEYARDVLGETPENKVRALQELSDIIYGKFYFYSTRKFDRVF